MSREEISGLAVWRELSPKLKRTLTLMFNDADHSLADAVEMTHPELTGDAVEVVVQNLMANPDVQRIISLFFGRQI
jgi:hypothetical protein